MPTALATARPVRCVASPGGSEQVSASTFAIVAGSNANLAKVSGGRYVVMARNVALAILDHDLSQATGELTPTLKVKRNIVNEKYKELFDSLYAS